MSKVFRGVKKAVKKVFRGVKKVFKKVIKSRFFKVALAAVAIYFGGAALGVWGAGAAQGTATAAAYNWGTGVGLNAGTGAVTGGGFAAGGGFGIPATPGVTTAATTATTTAAPTVASQIATQTMGGGVKRLLTNPYFASTMLKGVQAGFTQDPAEQQREWTEKDREEARRNWNVGGLDVTRPLPPGILNRKFGQTG